MKERVSYSVRLYICTPFVNVSYPGAVQVQLGAVRGRYGLFFVAGLHLSGNSRLALVHNLHSLITQGVEFIPELRNFAAELTVVVRQN